MPQNPNITFNLSRGNPTNDPVGIGIDKQVFGKSLGGRFFDTENLYNQEIIVHNLEKDGTNEVFDVIVPSDVIKSQVNYRAIYITNRSSLQSIPLDAIVATDVVPDPVTSTVEGSTGQFAITNITIACEDVYTINEVQRPVPTTYGKPNNPSIVLDDEYDSTNKLLGMNFKKILTISDIPLEIPPNCVLKLWIKREMIVDKDHLPDEELTESVSILVNEYNDETSTPITIQYSKNKGRVPLANWYDFTVTSGISKPIVMKELLPKNISLEHMNIIKTFVYNKIVILFYYVTVGSSKNYFLLTIQPDDNPDKNKYIQVQLNFNPILESGQAFNQNSIIDLIKSYYDPNIFYFFWDEKITNTDQCTLQYFGYYDSFTRISVDELFTHIWTSDESFSGLTPGYDNRKIESYELRDYKVIREKKQLINVEKFDDLFILFVKDTRNSALASIHDVVLNKNELLYLFEKDIHDPEKYSSYKHYPGINSQVFSQRLYPGSLPTTKYITSLNNVKNSDSSLIIENSSLIPRTIDENRQIKTLLDGTRYVDLNSVHGKAFDLQNNLMTYELPTDTIGLKNISITSSFKIKNDDNIYDSLKSIYSTTFFMNNIYDNVVYERPLFQQNVIDENVETNSIPIEWADREYKNEWKTILATYPVNGDSSYTLQYNFYCNVWRSLYLDRNGDIVTSYHNKLSPGGSTVTTTGSTGIGTTGTTGSSGTIYNCKKYTDINIKDFSWILEPDTFQPITVQIQANQIYSELFKTNKYIINLKIYFKGNEEPLADIVTYTNNLSSFSYMVMNPENQFNYKINYFDVYNYSEEAGNTFRIMNLHNNLLNKFITDIGPEYKVNPQLNPDQSEFEYYRIMNIRGIVTPNTSIDLGSDITIPIILYGNGYKKDNVVLNDFLEVEHPFDFTKIIFNDKSLRFYSDNNSKIPLKFKVSYYDYQKDMAVIWIRLQDFIQLNSKIYMYYGKIDASENRKNIFNNYSFIKSNIYPSYALGVWHFDHIIEDNRLAFNTGKIFNAGEPVIYEKSLNNELKLTQIEKEYMFGIANVFKSHKFNVNVDVEQLSEPELMFDENEKEEFEKFIKDSIHIFKPSYTEINTIKPFNISVLEAGEDPMGIANNRRVTGLIAMSPSSNVNTYYERLDNTKFNMLTSFNGFSQLIDWVVSQQMDSTLFKAGVIKINGKVKSETVKFDKAFKDTDYFVFLSGPGNEKIYWNTLCPDRFTISSSYYLEREVSWMAFHRDIFGGVFTPNSIYVGKRTLTSRVFIDSNGNSYSEWPGENPSITFPSPSASNLTYWYNNELIIKPEYGVEGDPGSMSIDPTSPGYSIILSSNKNINTYWTEKSIDQFRIRTSAPLSGVIHYLVVKNGIEWWKEIV